MSDVDTVKVKKGEDEKKLDLKLKVVKGQVQVLSKGEPLFSLDIFGLLKYGASKSPNKIDDGVISMAESPIKSLTYEKDL